MVIDNHPLMAPTSVIYAVITKMNKSSKPAPKFEDDELFQILLNAKQSRNLLLALQRPMPRRKMQFGSKSLMMSTVCPDSREKHVKLRKNGVTGITTCRNPERRTCPILTRN